MKKIQNFLTILITFSIISGSAISAFAADSDSKNYKVIRLPQVNTQESVSVSRQTMPTKYSSVDMGYVSSVKNQGSLGSCWAFSAMSQMESLLLKKGYGEYDLSEEHLNHWATLREDDTGWNRLYSDGGFQSIPLGYFSSWSGPRKEADIPYRQFDNSPFSVIDKLGKTDFGVTASERIENNANTIKKAIMENGSVSTSYSDHNEYYNSNETAYYCPYYTENVSGHSISVVGWDDAYSKNNFNSSYRPKNNGAWLIKNSWGNYNSLGGYMWISYEDVYIFNAEVFGASFSLKDFEKINNNKKLYQNEIYGATYDFSISYIDTNDQGETVEMPVNNLTFFNVFDFTEQYDKLSSVIFSTTSVNSHYKVYYTPLKNQKPTMDKAKWIFLGSGTVPYNGYINVNTNNFQLPYEKGAIAVEIISDNDEYQSSMGCDEWLSTSTGFYRFYPDIKPNGSYIIFDEDLYELSDFYKDFFDDDIGSNFVIKAVTTGNASLKKGDVNTNGNVELNDAVLLQKSIAGTNPITAHNALYCSDMNKNGTIELEDAVLLQKYLSGINVQ